MAPVARIGVSVQQGPEGFAVVAGSGPEDGRVGVATLVEAPCCSNMAQSRSAAGWRSASRTSLGCSLPPCPCPRRAGRATDRGLRPTRPGASPCHTRRPQWWARWTARSSSGCPPPSRCTRAAARATARSSCQSPLPLCSSAHCPTSPAYSANRPRRQTVTMRPWNPAATTNETRKVDGRRSCL